VSSPANLPGYRTLLRTVDGAVATITPNRPKQLADAYRACDRATRRVVWPVQLVCRCCCSGCRHR